MARFKINHKILFFSSILIILIALPTLVTTKCTCDEEDENRDRRKDLRYKITALVSILIPSAVGVCISFLSKIVPALSPDKNVFFLVTAFAAGVILATGFIHILLDVYLTLLKRASMGEFSFTGLSGVILATEFIRILLDAFENLTSPYLKEHPWEIFPSLVTTKCTCDQEDENRDRGKYLRYKIKALVSILIAGAVGVCIPFLGKVLPALSPDKNVFFQVKAFAVGVNLATGFIHILLDAFENLTSPYLKEHPWEIFPSLGLC
ncbi:hypothetical protein V8G54_009186 [Vigna mungo]|uniref:Uncharacterized protein n=1 Tax=Vigna mungo TaxID=3915 RepID=A0AAQ3S582_VIGMU